MKIEELKNYISSKDFISENKKLLRVKAIKSKEDSKKFSLKKMIVSHSNLYKRLINK